MRLLFFDSGELFFKVFAGTLPPYAILSHVWDKDEFTYDDLVNHAGTNKAGYEKIKFCAKQAAQDQLQYFWIDTCCINKWDVHERSKAINSMFRWYQNATKCYVYLADVSTSTTTDPPQHSHDWGTWEVSFRTSKWFTRGWTLQELI